MLSLTASGQSELAWQHVSPRDNASSSGDVNLTLQLQTDCWPEETTWAIRNDVGEIVFDGGPYYGQSLTEITEAFWLESGFYTFTFYDAAGDGLFATQWNGLCSANGNFTLVDAAENVLLTDDGTQNFDSLSVSFDFNAAVGIDNPESPMQWTVFPNPVSQQLTLRLDVVPHQAITVRAVDMRGAIFAEYQYTRTSDIRLDVSEWPAGIYSIQLICDGIRAEKRIVKTL